MAVVTTYGDAAHAILLQSIGGGGGVFGAGSSSTSTKYGDRVATVDMGAGFITADFGSAASNGGAVTANLDSTSQVTITTHGNGAFGVLGQSVGAGGGVAAVVPGTKVDVGRFGSTGQTGSGGTVTIELLNPSGSITTSGVGAHGIVAQSVGSGGGIVGNYKDGEIPELVMVRRETKPGQAGGRGGDVSVISTGTVTTTGAGAFGILAQSISGGGGIIANDGVVFAGQTGLTGGVAGSVGVTAQGKITASGINSIGIFAQAKGPNGLEGGLFDANPISINLGYYEPAEITGGRGPQGAGIVVNGGANGNGTNVLTVGEGSTVQAASGVAVKALDESVLDVTNHGKIYGTVILHGGKVSDHQPISTSAADAAGTMTNTGTLEAVPDQVSYLAGHLVQTATGRLAPDLDYAGLRSGRFEITGNATLDGSIRPTLATAMPNVFLPVLQVNGTVTGSLHAPDSPLFSYTLRENAQAYDLAITGAHFDDSRYSLTEHKSGLASSLQNLFFQEKPQLGAFFASLDETAGLGGDQYQKALGELSPRSAMTLFSRVAADASEIADASMSCPKFGGAGALATLTEGECAYVMTRGQHATLSGDADRGSAHLDSVARQLGAQTEIGPDLLLGGSLAYQSDWFGAHDGVSADGSSVQGAITLKYQTGPWLLTGALFGSYGEYDIERRVFVPGSAAVANADAPLFSGGLRARVAYTLGDENVYLRPYLNLDLVHAQNGSFSEDGVGDLGLRVDQGKYSTAILTPAAEVGSRLELSNGMVLRSFVSAGVSLRSNDTWKGDASFNGGHRDQGFAMNAPIDQVTGRIGAGVQLYQSEHIDLRVQYDGEIGSEATSHGGTASFAYRF
jgi:hypothetical protein